MWQSATQSPIIVTGPPRSGTTWMQWFLSLHPRIHIYGQESEHGLDYWFSFLNGMITAGQWSANANKTKELRGYPVPHYAGSDPNRCREIWAKAFEGFMSGFGDTGKPRWGCKFLWLCSDPEKVKRFEHIWKDIKWVVCIRDPFVSFASQKNTFVKNMDFDVWMSRWMETVNFACTHPSILFQIDKLSTQEFEKRLNRTKELLYYIQEPYTSDLERFVRDWGRVHQVKKPNERTFQTPEEWKAAAFRKYNKLEHYLEILGYKE